MRSLNLRMQDAVHGDAKGTYQRELQSTSLSYLPTVRDHPTLCGCGLSPSLAGVFQSFQSHPTTRFEPLSHGNSKAHLLRALAVLITSLANTSFSACTTLLRALFVWQILRYGGAKWTGGVRGEDDKDEDDDDEEDDDRFEFVEDAMRPSLVRRAPTMMPTPPPVPPTGTQQMLQRSPWPRPDQQQRRTTHARR